jgi:hypothetical protein
MSGDKCCACETELNENDEVCPNPECGLKTIICMGCSLKFTLDKEDLGLCDKCINESIYRGKEESDEND